MSDPDARTTYNGPSESGSSKPGSTVGDKIKCASPVLFNDIYA